MMVTSMSRCGLVIMALSTPVLTGCDLPKAGPGVGSLMARRQYQNGRQSFDGLVTREVTIKDALETARQIRAEDAARIRQSAAAINVGSSTRNSTLHRGDDITVSILSFSGGSEGLGAAPSVMRLGRFSIMQDGTVDLPYLGPVQAMSLTCSQMQRKLSRLYAERRIFSNPSVIVRADGTEDGQAADSVLVVGQVNHPREVRWRAGGMTLAHVLAEAMGGETVMMAETSDGGVAAPARYATVVSVVREGQVVGELPISEALSGDVFLAPHDRVIVKKTASIMVPVLGGGAARPGAYAFGVSPTLAEVLAMSGGLRQEAASSRAVFVLRYDHGRPCLLRIPFDRVYGLFVAQNFLLKSGDVVYVAESSWMPYLKVFSLIVQAGVLVSIAR